MAKAPAGKKDTKAAAAPSTEAETVEETVEAKTPPAFVGPMSVRNLLPVQAAKQDWCFTAPVGVTPEYLEQPEVWKHVAADRKVKPNCKFYITAADGSWYGEFYVTYVSGTDIKMECLFVKPLADANSLADRTETHKVEYSGPAQLFVVKRLSDGAVIKHGFGSAVEASLWMHKESALLAA